MLDKLKNLFTKKVDKPVAEGKPKKSRKVKQEKPALSAKEQATHDGQPYVAILKVDVDPNNINAGSFELDWNDKFVINLIKAGYKLREDETDQVVVDRWFQTVCRNIALEVYEQQVADPANRDYDDIRRVQSKNLGNGRTEVS